jgi:conjugative relaxase-like TrwC/TraI family protein
MLSIGKMGAGSEDYYLHTVASGREEYYTGSGEAPGYWVGAGLAELGLSGEVTPEDLRAVLAGFAPDGRSLTAGRVRPEARVSGFDLTWSAPKSVSLLYGLSDADVSTTVRDAHTKAVADALGYIERQGLRGRRGAGGEFRIGAQGLVAAAFVHRTSRAGDPQLHTHVLVANVAHGVDGKWSAPDARLLYFHARTAGFLYQAALRAGLTDALGVHFGPVINGTAELADVPPLLLRAFSTRRIEIERYMAARGTTSARAAEVAALATRSPKEVSGASGLATGSLGLRQRWLDRVTDLGFADDNGIPTLEGLLGSHDRTPITEGQTGHLVTHLTGPEGLTGAESTFERRDVVRSVAELMAEGASVKEVEAIADRALASAEVVPVPSIGRGGELRHTTTELLEVESALLGRAVARRDAGAGAGLVDVAQLDAALARFPILADEQQRMVRVLVTSGDGVELVVGKAGTGKTLALSAARHAWESDGYRVRGAALSAKAAQGLEGGAGITATTLTRLLGDLDSGRLDLGDRDVLVIDEAGMVGTRNLAVLIDAASQSGSKLVLVGDPRQLPEIEAGGAFAGLMSRIGAIELTENRRQHELWERGALDQLRHGNPALGLAAFDTAQRVVTAASMAEARTQLVERWMESTALGEESIMMAVNRRDVAALNDRARVALRDAGKLGPDIVITDEINLAVGDRIVCLRNDAKIAVLNGTYGVVRSAERGGVTVITSDGLRQLPESYLCAGHLAHGYAVTVHKAQGATVDRAFVLATDSLTREAGYVAMSRARKGTELFVPVSSFEDGIVASPWQESTPLDAVARRLTISRAKAMATDELASGQLNAAIGDDHGSMEVGSEPEDPTAVLTNDSGGPVGSPARGASLLGRDPRYLEEGDSSGDDADSTAGSVRRYREPPKGERAAGQDERRTTPDMPRLGSRVRIPSSAPKKDQVRGSSRLAIGRRSPGGLLPRSTIYP